MEKRGAGAPSFSENKDMRGLNMNKDKAVSLYKFKRGANSGYESLKDKRERGGEAAHQKQGLLEVKKTKTAPISRFIAGSYFRTSLGLG